MTTGGFYLDRETFYLFLYCIIPMLSLAGSGSNIGYSGIALPALTNGTDDLKLTNDQIPWFASITIITQMVGCLIVIVTMSCGRRAALISGGLVSIIGWIVIATSYSVEQLFVGRALTGLSTGMCSSPGTVYVAEISTRRWTALLTSWCSIFIFVGITLIYSAAYFFQNEWRIVAAIAIIAPAICVLGTIFVLPESPRWLLTKNRVSDARRALRRIRGLQRENVKFQDEFSDMVRYSERKNDFEMSSQVETSFGDISAEAPRDTLNVWWKVKCVVGILRLPEVWKPLLILQMYFCFLYFSGIFVVNSYAVDIMADTVSSMEPFTLVFALSWVQLIAGIVHVCCSTKIGRRPFSIISCLGMAISLCALTVHSQFFDSILVPAMPIAFAIIFTASSSLGMTVIPWALIGELYPTKYVNVLGSLTTCLGSIYNFAAVLSFPAIAEYSTFAALYLYSAVDLFAAFFLAFLLPETLGKTKTEIEEGFKNKLSSL